MTTPHPPLYIPGEICGTVGADPASNPDQCLAIVQQQVTAGNISAPPAVTPALLQVIDQAHDDGIDLKIVVLDHNPPNDTPLRDIATVVGAQHPDATVLVLSPNFVGSYSTHFPRATLEIGEDNAKTGNTVVSATEFSASARNAAVSLDRIHHRAVDRGIRQRWSERDSCNCAPSGQQRRKTRRTRPLKALSRASNSRYSSRVA